MGLLLLLSLKMNKATKDTEEYEMEGEIVKNGKRRKKKTHMPWKV